MIYRISIKRYYLRQNMAGFCCSCNHNHTHQKHKPYTPHHGLKQFNVVFINHVGGGGGGEGKFVGSGGGGGAACPLPGRGGP